MTLHEVNQALKGIGRKPTNEPATKPAKADKPVTNRPAKKAASTYHCRLVKSFKRLAADDKAQQLKARIANARHKSHVS